MPPVASRAPTSLSARVSLIRLWSAVSPPSFPRTFPCARALFPPRGPSGRFPRFLGTTKHSDFLPPLPRRFVSFASRYRRCALVFVPADARRNRCGPGVVNRNPQHRLIDGDDRTSQVPGGPHYERALLFDPGGILALGRYHASMLPSAFTTASASAISIISGLNHTARSLAVYASQGELPHHHVRLASGWLASLSGRELVTRWVPMKGFRLFHSPFPGFAWRTIKFHESAQYPFFAKGRAIHQRP